MPRSHSGLIRLLRREKIEDRIIEAFRAVPRDLFVPPQHVGSAYLDRPVPLPEGQTTSQPSLIARMLEALRPQPGDRALEVGTGFGFQTAVLALLVAEVHSIERFGDLAEAARRNLDRAGIANVQVIVGNGWEGVPEHAPFDVIVVSAAASEVPRALEDQLAEGGRLVIPVRSATTDEVLLFERAGEQVRKIALLTPARFVPLVRGEAR